MIQPRTLFLPARPPGRASLYAAFPLAVPAGGTLLTGTARNVDIGLFRFAVPFAAADGITAYIPSCPSPCRPEEELDGGARIAFAPFLGFLLWRYARGVIATIPGENDHPNT
jgi:hypothetical protein